MSCPLFLLMSLGSMSHVDLKKCPCRRVEFRDRGPYDWQESRVGIEEECQSVDIIENVKTLSHPTIRG